MSHIDHKPFYRGLSHGNFQDKSFLHLCRFLPRQMLACLRAFSLASAKAGLLFEVMA